MKIYKVIEHKTGKILGLFKTEELAKLSVDLTYAKVPERKEEVEIKEDRINETIEHL